MNQSRPLLALWLDSADAALIKRWIGDGCLPNLKRLFDGGIYADLKSFAHSRAEVMQSIAITGNPPEETGFWGIHHFDPKTYRSSDRGIYDYRRIPPYFALGPGYRVAAIDFPQYAFHDGVNGFQVRNWGCHSAMTPSDSRPDGVITEFDREFGVPPSRAHDHAVLQSPEDMRQLIDDLHTGIDRWTHLVETVASREPWNLFLGVCGCLHKAAHYLVPNPETLDLLGRDDPWRPLREVHEQLDRSLGRFMEKLLPTWNIAVYSFEGIEDYSDEVQNTFLLADLLLRDSFGGRAAFVYEDSSRGSSPEAAAGVINWVMECWHTRRRPSRVQEWVRARFGRENAAAVDAWFGLMPYPERATDGYICNYQPLIWLEKYRPHQRAFSLPTFSDGFIRLNVKGREARGKINPGRFLEERARILGLSRALKHPRTGGPAVSEVIATRDDPFDCGPDRHPADLVIKWHPLDEGGCFESPTLGRIGPAPALRAGTHSDRGFFGAIGADLPCGKSVEGRGILDIAPTLLALIQAQPPSPLPGRSLLG